MKVTRVVTRSGRSASRLSLSPILPKPRATPSKDNNNVGNRVKQGISPGKPKRAAKVKENAVKDTSKGSNRTGKNKPVTNRSVIKPPQRPKKAVLKVDTTKLKKKNVTSSPEESNDFVQKGSPIVVLKQSSIIERLQNVASEKSPDKSSEIKDTNKTQSFITTRGNKNVNQRKASKIENNKRLLIKKGKGKENLPETTVNKETTTVPGKLPAHQPTQNKSKNDSINAENHHLPVYKQVPLDEDAEKDKEELYEFDSDSEKPKKKIVRKRKLKRDQKNEPKVKRVKNQKKDVVNEETTYERNVENILSNMRNRIQKRRSASNENKTNEQEQNKENITDGPVTTKETTNNKSTKNKEATDDEDRDSLIDVAPQTRRTCTSVTLPNNELQITHQGSVLIEDLLHEDSILKAKDHNDNNTSSEIQKNFGFTEEKGPKINVVSNVSIQSGRNPQPWRFNINIFRKDILSLSVKENCLPNISQECPLDSTFVERFERSTKTPRRVIEETPRTPVQKTMLDYYGDKENQINQSSLFDDHYFSPIAQSDSPRKVLSPKTSVNAFSTPCTVVVRKKFSPDLSAIVDDEKSRQEAEQTYFGFQHDDEEENIIEDAAKRTLDQPFRAPSSVARKYKVVKRQNKTKEVESPKSFDDEDEERDESEDENNETHQLGLFEDFQTEKKTPTKHHGRKPKWMKLIEGEDKRKKKRRDIRTPAEEEEAEKWVESFNAMCREVEEFPLEIE